MTGNIFFFFVVGALTVTVIGLNREQKSPWSVVRARWKYAGLSLCLVMILSWLLWSYSIFLLIKHQRRISYCKISNLFIAQDQIAKTSLWGFTICREYNRLSSSDQLYDYRQLLLLMLTVVLSRSWASGQKVK